MKPSHFAQWCFVALWCLSCLSGCETFEGMKSDQKFQTPDAHYDQILEEQKAGLEQKEPLAELPAMSVDEHERLGDAHMEQGQWAMALTQYDEVLKTDPNRTATRYKVGILLLKIGKMKLANQEFDTILEHDDKFALAWEGKGQALLAQEDLFGADQAFRRALTLNPNLWRAHNYLGILADRRHLHLSAIEAYQAALAIKSREGSILNNLGMAYYMNGQYKEAAKNFHMAMQTGIKTPKVANNLGLALVKLGKYPQAFDAFKIGTDPAKAYNNIGIAYLEAGQPQRAISCFEKAIELEPSYYEKANENLVQAKRAAKRMNQASSSRITACM